VANYFSERKITQQGKDMKKQNLIFIIFFGLIIFCFAQRVEAEVIPDDRKIDWSYAGIPSGIPERTTICANVKNAPYNAKGDGVTDDSEAIKAAIAACPTGQVVFFPEGSYLVKKIISISKGIVLRGAGPKLSKIIFDHRDYSTQYGYNAEMGLAVGSASGGTSYIPITSGYQKGSTQITLQDASSFSVGNYLILVQDNDSDFVNEVGYQGACTWCGFGRCSLDPNTKCNTWDTNPCVDKGVCEGGKLALGQVLRITAVNGNTLTLETPLIWNYLSQFNPRVVKMNNMVEGFGVEDLYFTQIGDKTKKMMKMQGCAYCWIRNIESERSTMRHIEGYYSYRNQFVENYLHHSNCYIGNYGYGFAFFSYPSYNLVQNNIFNSIHLSFATEGGGGGNVFGYNYSVNGLHEGTCGEANPIRGGGVIFHGSHPVFNLIEGNKFSNGMGDFIWGSSSYMTAFRNRITGSGDLPGNNWRKAIKIEMYQRYFNIVGNVLGAESSDDSIYEASGGYADTYNNSYLFELGYKSQYTTRETNPENDPVVKQTLLRWGNFDYVNKATRWEAGEVPASMSVPADHNLPASLYLSAKPTWFGSLNFPAIGPDISPMEQKIPAQVRYEQMGALCSKGDFDCNTKFDALDISFMINIILKLNPTPEEIFKGDMNTDNKVDSLDLNALIKEVLK